MLEEVAKSWKKISVGVIVEGDGNELKTILRNLEGTISGGRIIHSRDLSRQSSFALGDSQEVSLATRLGERPRGVDGEDSQSSLGLSTLEVEDETEDDTLKDPRQWLKVVDAFEQPRLIYNMSKKHFDR